MEQWRGDRAGDDLADSVDHLAGLLPPADLTRVVHVLKALRQRQRRGPGAMALRLARHLLREVRQAHAQGRGGDSYDADVQAAVRAAWSTYRIQYIDGEGKFELPTGSPVSLLEESVADDLQCFAGAIRIVYRDQVLLSLDPIPGGAGEGVLQASVVPRAHWRDVVNGWHHNDLATWVNDLSERPLADLEGSWGGSREFFELVEEIDRIYRRGLGQRRGPATGADADTETKEILNSLKDAAGKDGATLRSILDELQEDFP